MAPRKCYVCENKGNWEGLHFHGLPSCEDTRKQWLQWIAEVKGSDINILPSKKNILVCSDHFKPEQKGLRKLLPRAVPYQFNSSTQVPAVQSADGASNNSTLEENISRTDELTVIATNNTSLEANILNSDKLADIATNKSTREEPMSRSDELADRLDTSLSLGNDLPNTVIFSDDCDAEVIDYEVENAFCDFASMAFVDQFSSIVYIDMTVQNVQSPTTSNVSCAHPNVTEQSSFRKSPTGTRKWKRCAANGCTGSRRSKYFSFPSVKPMINNINYTNLDRCKVFIQNSGNLSLLAVETSKLHSKYYLCSEHFRDDQFYNIDRKTLLPYAIPTEFNCLPLTDIQMMQYPNLSFEDTLTRNHVIFPDTLANSYPEMDMPGNGQNNDNQDNTLDGSQIRFESYMNTLQWITCENCKEKFSKPSKSNTKCLHSKNICAMYTKDNDMDPLDVPEELKQLTYVEEQLIARVHPLISVFKLSGYHQLGYRGNIINLPQDVKSFAKCLPHTIDDLSLITIRTRNELKPIDFNVRGGKVHAALLWLKDNNPFYTDIEINEENIAMLPEDGNIFDKVTRVINIDAPDEPDEDDFEPTEDDEENQYNVVTETCIPSFAKPTSSEKAETLLQWPEIGKEAINEFKTPGYIAMAFPTLFPYGKADLRNLRERTVSPNQYFKHLLQYHDERFAKHPRFRYFALNSLMRWNALRNGGMFVKKNSAFYNMNAKQLKEELANNPNLLKKILFYNSNLRGTRSYWYARGQELLSMVEQLGLPTLFFTLSAADLHWPDLFHYLEPDEDPNTMTETRRRKLIEENPLKVDSFFMERGQTFITEVLKSKYNVKDMWFRIEYQHRGSPHIHGVLWLADAPKFTDLKTASPEKLQEIASYFDLYVSTMHPDINCPRAPIHPCRQKLSEVIDLKKDLAELLNRVQRHTEHRDGYCMRINKKSKKKECRFKFPKDFAERTEIKLTEDNDVELVTARNDRYLNKYNSFIIQTWRANIDVSPVLSKRALVNYLAKYITKSETRSEDLKQIVQMLMDKNEEDKHAKSIVQQLYIQCCCERDISAQETCHLLMGLPLVSAGGRKFQTLNFKVLDEESWVPVVDDETRNSKSYIEKYMERQERFENSSLWEMAKNFILPSGRRQTKGKETIVQVYPKMTKSLKDADPEQYYRQQVLLFVPWRYEDEILQKYGSWQEAFEINEELISDSFQPECDLDNIQPDESEYENIDPEDSITAEEWMCISQMGSSQTAEKIELGRREIDINHNWHEASEKYQQYGGVEVIANFISEQKKKISPDTDVPQMPAVDFTREQKSVLDLLRLQIEFSKQGKISFPADLPRSVIVQGKAGTGKSLVIHAMKSLITESLGPDALVLLGPTGVSALNIGGSTIHSKLHIHPKSRELIPLPGNALHDFRQKFSKTLFVIIDEYSMVGCKMLNILEKRLKQALDKDRDQFGDVFIYFFGDIQQLAPVGDSAAYSDNQVSVDYIDGKLLYESIEAAIVLSEVKRQNDTNFLKVLSNISTGDVTMADYNILKKRFTSSVTAQEKKNFIDAIRLFPQRVEVDAYNQEALQSLRNPTTKQPMPIARIPANHNCTDAKLGTENEAGGLKSILYLSKGAKIMLRANLWTEQGLVNGAIGTVVDILYKDGDNPPDEAPTALVCKFDSYKGPYLNEENTVVIKTLSKQWKSKKGTDCVREQFPISLCYACSIHKSQGLTLDKAYINIGALKEMSPGLTYTALSRVKSLTGLLLEPFGSKRLLGINQKHYVQKRAEWIDRLRKKQMFL